MTRKTKRRGKEQENKNGDVIKQKIMNNRISLKQKVYAQFALGCESIAGELRAE